MPKHPMQPLVLVLLSVVALLLSGYLWVHALGIRSTKVVESVKILELEQRYTVPARSRQVAIAPEDGMYTTVWDDAFTVHYETWIITSFDGFEVELSKVDPLNRPDISRGTRYTAFWR